MSQRLALGTTGLVVVFLLSACGGAGAAAPEAGGAKTTWVVANGGTEQCWSTAAAACPDGSTVVTGQFYGTNTFGAGTPNETTLSALDASDIWLACLDGQGVLRWAREIRGMDYTEVHGVDVAPSGAVYVSGYFYGDITFAEGTPLELSFVTADGDDGFVACYRADGTFAWARQIASGGYDEALDLAARPDGSVAVVGLFGGALTLGAGGPTEATIYATADMDAFVACFGPEGDFLWSRGTQTVGYAGAWGVDVAADGSVVVAGDFTGTSTHGALEPQERTLLSVEGSTDVFVARFEADGNMQWVRALGGPADDYSSSLALAADGGVRVGGMFGDVAVFDEAAGADGVLASAGGFDAFVVAYDAGGAFEWVRGAGGDGMENVQDVTLLSDGTTLAIGSFEVELALGAGEVSLAAEAEADIEMFAVRYGLDGALLGGAALGGAGDDYGVELVPQADGTVVLVGCFEDRFDLGDPDQVIIGEPGAFCAFIARWDLANLR